MRQTERAVLFAAVFLASSVAGALEMDRLRVQRKEVFEFTEKPSVSQEGDRVTIRFTVKDYCDATVAIEHKSGKILRHLASGVLGANTPAPFQKNSLKQEIVWDGKDEIGCYVDNKQDCQVRVSLGLRPRMERTLFWSPKKRHGSSQVLISAVPEGVCVFDGAYGGRLRLFSHEGGYLRTLYPFPARQISKVDGLKWLQFPPDNERLPSKLAGHDQDSFLPDDILGMDASKGQVLLLGSQVTRVAIGSGNAGAKLNGPEVGVPIDEKGKVGPHSAAHSPDGKWIYLTGYGYNWSRWGHGMRQWFHGVQRLDTSKPDAKAEPFAGDMQVSEKGAGKDNAHFRCPTSVACDGKGRVYVTDHYNNRIQVFHPDGKLFKSVPFDRPSQIRVDPRTGQMYVFSWHVHIRLWGKPPAQCADMRSRRHPATLTILGPVEKPAKIASYALPDVADCRDAHEVGNGRTAFAEVDFHTKPPTIWLAPGTARAWRSQSWKRTNIRLLQVRDKKLVTVNDFSAAARKTLVRPRPIRHGRQRLFVNQASGKVYVGEHTSPTQVACKSFYEMPRIDPDKGKIKLIQLPTDAEDMGFDWEGRAYLRAFNAISRFDPRTWREVPFDYGEERRVYHGQGGGGERPYFAVSAITLPSVIGGMFHMGGMGVSPQGNIIVSCINPNAKSKAEAGRKGTKQLARKVSYRARVYPGRYPGWEVHVFDIYGNLLKDDAFPGLNHTTMVKIDRENNVYGLAAGAPYLDGKCYFNGRGCTLIKGKLGEVRVLSGKATIPLSKETRPKRPFDLARPGLWAEGAEWLFGPVGAEGHYGSGGHCSCYVNGNFDLDYYGRSFAPEIDRFRVVVLDTNGNVITRIGKYGNVDDGVPLVKPDPKLAGKMGEQPLAPRSIGGDEVAIMHAQNLAVHTDRRLFLADVGNDCIRSVKLEYHAAETISLRAGRGR